MRKEAHKLQKVTLAGQRQVDLAGLTPEEAYELGREHGLVDGEIKGRNWSGDRVVAVFASALHERYGFGHKRIMDLLQVASYHYKHIAKYDDIFEDVQRRLLWRKIDGEQQQGDIYKGADGPQDHPEPSAET